MYSHLQQAKSTDSARFRSQWESVLQTHFTDSQWESACILAHKCSISTRLQENSYKLLTHWYATPEKIKRWYPSASDLCWRCGEARGDIIFGGSALQERPIGTKYTS